MGSYIRRLYLAILCVSIIVVDGSSGIAFGQERSAGDLINRLDRDGDGGLSLDEVPSRLQRLRDNFDLLDRNGDGRITASELDAVRRQRQGSASTPATPDKTPVQDAGPATVPSGGGTEAIRARMQQAITNKELPGAVVLFMHNGVVVFEEAYGFANLESKRPQRVDDLFNLGSTSKPLAMTTIMTQIAEGKLSLEDSIARWYPQYAAAKLVSGTAAKRLPVVREMMSHVSGTFANKCGNRRDLFLLYRFGHTLKESADAIAAKPLVSQPGESFCYGGPSMQVLGRVVELITGEEFDAVAKARVLSPLRMDDTFYRTSQDLGDRITVIYEKSSGGGLQRSRRMRNPRGDPFILVPGGVYSTAHDLARFLQAHLQGGVFDGQRILPEELVREMRRNQIGSLSTDFGDPALGEGSSAALGEIEGYGLGWILDEIGADGRGRVFSHGGIWGTYIWGDVEAQLGAVLLTQTPLPNTTKVWNDILGMARTAWGTGEAEGTGKAATGVWQPEVRQIGRLDTKYIDPEILSSENLMVFQDQGGSIWIGKLDPTNGLLQSGDGKDILLGSGAFNLLESFNGPEFGLDARGWSVFFTKTHGGIPQIWRARLNGEKSEAMPLTTDGQRRQSILASKNAQAASIKLIYVQGKRGDGRFFWSDEDRPTTETPVVRVKGTDSPRWIDDTLQFVFAESDGADAGQLKLVDTATGNVRTITSDTGVKSFAYGWKAPEYRGEILVLAMVDQKAVGVWRDTGKSHWERIATLTAPPEARYGNVGSPEPLVSQGRSYVSLVLKDGTSGRFRDSEVWILGIEADQDKRFARRVDDGRSPMMRSDPETFVGDNEIFVYYNVYRRSAIEVHRARTGLGK